MSLSYALLYNHWGEGETEDAKEERCTTRSHNGSFVYTNKGIPYMDMSINMNIIVLNHTSEEELGKMTTDTIRYDNK